MSWWARCGPPDQAADAYAAAAVARVNKPARDEAEELNWCAMIHAKSDVPHANITTAIYTVGAAIVRALREKC